MKKRIDELGHLLQVMKALGSVNHLISSTDDIDRICDGICEILIESRGYNNAWIVLFKNNKPAQPYYHAGFGRVFQGMTDILDQGIIPPCAQKAIRSSRISVIQDPAKDCETCPFPEAYADESAYSHPLKRGEQLYGWMSVSVSKEFAEDKEEQALFSELVNDISLALENVFSKKKKEQALQSLKESEERFQMLFEKAPLGYQSLDENGSFLEVNQAWLDLLGYKKDEVLGHWFGDFLASEYVEPFRERFPLFKKRGKIHSEFYMLTKSGEKRYISFEGRIGKKEDGSFFQTHCILSDYTEKKAAEEALIESEAYFRNIFENIKTGIAIYEPLNEGEDFLISDMNEASQSISHVDLEEIRGRRITEVFPGVEEMGLLDVIWSVWKDGEARILPISSYKDDQLNLWAENYVSRLPSGRILVLYDDRTEYQEMEKRIRQSEKMEAIGQLAGGIAHDFNNILCGILGYGELALQKYRRKEAGIERYLESILKAGDRAKELVEQILTFSRQSGDEKNPQKLVPIIKEVLHLLRASLPTSIELVPVLGEESRSVLVNSTKIHEILINLCTNAAYAMSNKGKLEIHFNEIQNEKSLQGVLGDIPPGCYSVITVRDCGIGMDNETLSRIFEPFYTTKKQGEGTGMGLSVVFGIINDHHGNLQVESQLGEGSEFKVFLPQVIGKHIPEKKEKESSFEGSEHIVFVDDEQNNCEIVKELLTAQGYSVSTYSNSRQALDEIRRGSKTVDLVVTDQTMPELTGLELASRLKSDNPDLPVILCTGFSREISEKSIADTGVETVIYKPFRLNDLSENIRSILDKKKTV
jgi:PAS domain S-box-containing protein